MTTRNLRESFEKLELAKLEAEKQHPDDMPGNNHSNTETAPPHAQLIQMALAFWTSRIVYVAAKLGLADHLSNGPKSADELAGETGTHAPSLYRVMRTLASLGILTEEDGFDWLAKSPRDASLFSETMIGFHGAEPAAVAAAYDFSGLTTIVDVGGATGNLLTTILGSQPRTRGILFDLPHVVSDIFSRTSSIIGANSR